MACCMRVCRLQMAIRAAAVQPGACVSTSGSSQHASAASLAGRRLAGQQQTSQGTAGREAFPSGLWGARHGSLGQLAGLSSHQGTFTESANVV